MGYAYPARRTSVFSHPFYALRIGRFAPTDRFALIKSPETAGPRAKRALAWDLPCI